MSQKEILAAQKAWRMQKRREIEARNKKKAARQQIVDTNNYNPNVPQHSAAATTQAAPQNAILPPPVKRLKTYHADNAQLAAPPVDNATSTTAPVLYSVNSFPTSQAGTYQHYEYVGAQTLLPNTNAPSSNTVQALQNDEQSRTIEAQRAWKERKLMELAEKKSKNTPSKRGRRKGVNIAVPVDEETLLGNRSENHPGIPIVTPIGVSVGLTNTSMPLNAQHSMPIASHGMALSTHALVQSTVSQQNTEADAETGETAAELVAMANQTMAQNPLEQYTFMSATEHKDEPHQVEQTPNVESHQQQLSNVEPHQQQIPSVEEHHQQQQVVENVGEHPQHQPQMENITHHTTQHIQNVAEHQQQIENVAEHQQQIENVAQHQEQMQQVEGQQQVEQTIEVRQPVENVEQHHQHDTGAVTVPIHPEPTRNDEGHVQTAENVQVADQQGATVGTHQVEAENVETHGHEGETVMVAHHRAQDAEEVKNVQETKAETLDANGVGTENTGGTTYAETATAGDSFQIDGSDDIMGAAAAWHEGLGNINQH